MMVSGRCNQAGFTVELKRVDKEAGRRFCELDCDLIPWDELVQNTVRFNLFLI